MVVGDELLLLNTFSVVEFCPEGHCNICSYIVAIYVRQLG